MIKRTIRKWCPNIIHQWYADTKYYIRFKFYPQGLANEMHRGIVGHDINWGDPKTLNEKINWMKFYGDTSQWPVLADKIRVREYVAERIGVHILPKIYGIWDKVSDIDLNKLPKKFVFKTNHGCGMVIPVVDKSLIDEEYTKKKLGTWIKERFGYATVEPHYLKIPPRIYAEEYLDNDSTYSSSLVDYKVFCLSGKPYCILVCTDRILGEHTNLSFYDCEWNPIDNILSGNHTGEFAYIPKPSCLKELLDYASKLSKGHPQVRVDFYIINNKVYFGEMTFTSQGGYMDYISREYDLDMGAHVFIPSKEYSYN